MPRRMCKRLDIVELQVLTLWRQSRYIVVWSAVHQYRSLRAEVSILNMTEPFKSDMYVYRDDEGHGEDGDNDDVSRHPGQDHPIPDGLFR